MNIVPFPRSYTVVGDSPFNIKGKSWSVAAAILKNPAISHKLITLRIKHKLSSAAPFRISAGEISYNVTVPDKPQGYALRITETGLLLEGADFDGVFWGLVTVEQLLNGGYTLPCVDITDWPQVTYRGHHDDISRKQISTVNGFKEIIHHLSQFKINQYMLYIEDMLHLKQFPTFGEGRGKLMPSEVSEIVYEGKLHNVDIIPSFQLIGHSENMLAQPEFSQLGRKVFQPMSSLDPNNPAVRDFLKIAIAEVCQMFPSKYFFMGFDETQGVDKETFLKHANWCAEEIIKHGKIPGMWVDMIYKHFGYETAKDLHPAILVGNWNYHPKSNPVPHQRELIAQGRKVWGFAGYNNWCLFMPDFKDAKENDIDIWAGEYADENESYLACTQWGDGGYENSRIMCWNLFAYFAERAWSGINTPSNFEERFRSIFYGAPLPILDNVIKLADKLQLKPDEYWRMHRINAQGYTRLVKAKPELINEARHDEQLLFDAVQTVSACKRDAVREAEHLDHFTVALQRMATVTKRILFAAGDEKDVNTVIRTLAESCSNYQKVWLRNNKTENIEVSLRVFENAIASYNQANDIKDADKYLPVDLSDYYNFNSQEVCGLPIGGETLNGIPFKFAGNNKTQLNLGEIGTRTTISLPANKIRDLHMIITCPKPAAEKPAPGIRVELLKDENVVFTEELLLIAHLCDWWAPLGEHTWAGGGYRYADKNRVRYALSPNACFGLCEVFNFNLPDSEADKVRFTPLADNRAAIFALTLEKS
jgi:hypothetical protein